MRRSVAVAASFTAIAVLWTFVRDRQSNAGVHSSAVVDHPRLGVAPTESSRRPLPGLGEDPFAVPAPPAPPPAPPVSINRPSPPQRPPFPYEYFGRFTNMNGETDTYLRRDGQLVPIRDDMPLESGYVVESVTEAGAVIRHKPTGDVVRIDLPTYQRQ